MKTVSIGCEHSTEEVCLEIAEENICYIQCQLIQVRLSPAQTRRVCDHCSCMASKMYFEKQGGACMTIDPSQLDLKGKSVTIQPVG